MMQFHSPGPQAKKKTSLSVMPAALASCPGGATARLGGIYSTPTAPEVVIHTMCVAHSCLSLEPKSHKSRSPALQDLDSAMKRLYLLSAISVAVPAMAAPGPPSYHRECARACNRQCATHPICGLSLSISLQLQQSRIACMRRYHCLRMLMRREAFVCQGSPAVLDGRSRYNAVTGQ